MLGVQQAFVARSCSLFILSASLSAGASVFITDWALGTFGFIRSKPASHAPHSSLASGTCAESSVILVRLPGICCVEERFRSWLA